MVLDIVQGQVQGQVHCMIMIKYKRIGHVCNTIDNKRFLNKIISMYLLVL